MNKPSSELHVRSLWQVLGLYLAGGWLVLQVVDVLNQNLGLPQWVFRFALVLLAIGLPIVLLTAAFHGTGRKGTHGTESGRGLFTWRNAMIGGGAAVLLWTGVAVGWLLFGRGPDAAAGIDAVAGLEEVRQLVEANEFAEAYARVREIEPAFTDDSLRGELWNAATYEFDLKSDPPGAEVWARPYA